jgi:hypothetical protein
VAAASPPTPHPDTAPAAPPPRLRFDRHELAGAFGDIGTDLPLLLALILTCDLDAASVFIGFGALQVVTGIYYGLPMPVQPLKAMAAIMLVEKLSPGTLAGGGGVIGALMLVLTFSGALSWLSRIVTIPVVRGIQTGLGLSLGWLALRKYVVADGEAGVLIAVVCLGLLLLLRRQRRIPGPLVVLLVGVAWALTVKLPDASWAGVFGVRLPTLVVPTGHELLQGALLLALPQLPLSLGNSVLATSRTTEDLFPGRGVSVQRIGKTYGLSNLVAPLFGAVPVCHGCGGLVGFYNFGARTGGAPVIYGSFYLTVGLFFSPGFEQVLALFPLPVLGVVLLFEAGGLLVLALQAVTDRRSMFIVCVVAGCAVALPWGYLIGTAVGVVLVRLCTPAAPPPAGAPGSPDAPGLRSKNT